MGKRNFIALVIVLCLSQLMSCQQQSASSDEAAVSSELVNNPITASGEKKKSDLPFMEFETSKHDFGSIIQGEKVAYTFKFVNAGGADLIISSASSTCGCTVPSYSKKPLKPGEKGEIEVVFDSAGRTGSQHKSVSILTNAQPNTVRLEIEAEIIVIKK